MYSSTEKEVWKDVKGYEGIFKISNKGRLKRIKNSPNMPDNNILKGSICMHGYRYYNMKVRDKGKKNKAHRLVAIAFLENPDNLPQVNHIDGNKLNNTAENLEWCDQLHNNRHALATGLRKINMEHVRKAQRVSAHKQKKRVAQYNLDGTLVGEYDSLQEAAKGFNSAPNISRACRSKTRTAYGFRWKFIEE